MPRVVDACDGSVYVCNRSWPADVRVQAGPPSCTSTGSTRPGFFEVFPTDPETMLRATAPTIAEAEELVFLEYQKVTSCPGHEFDPAGYRNGAGVCIHCGMFAVNVFDPVPAQASELAVLTEIFGDLDSLSLAQLESARKKLSAKDEFRLEEIAYAFSELTAQKWLDENPL